MTDYYTGIGSRETPKEVRQLMMHLATWLDMRDWHLRSGGAAGADRAFSLGANAHHEEIYIPWSGFGGLDGEGVYLPRNWPNWHDAEYMAQLVHPAWHMLKSGGQLLHTRNVYQVLGRDLDTPSRFLVCYAEPTAGGVKGGTNTAWQIAKLHNIPCVNLFYDRNRENVKQEIYGS